MLFYLSFIMHKCIIYRKHIIEYIYINEKVIISVKIAITLKVTYNCLLKLNYYILSLHLFYFTSLKTFVYFHFKTRYMFYTSIFSTFPEKLGFPSLMINIKYSNKLKTYISSQSKYWLNEIIKFITFMHNPLF